MAGLLPRPNLPDATLDRVAARGIQHEHRFLSDPLVAVLIVAEEVGAWHFEQGVATSSELLRKAAARRGTLTHSRLLSGAVRNIQLSGGYLSATEEGGASGPMDRQAG